MTPFLDSIDQYACQPELIACLRAGYGSKRPEMTPVEPVYRLMSPEELREEARRAARRISILIDAREYDVAREQLDLAKRLSLRAVQLEQGAAA